MADYKKGDYDLYVDPQFYLGNYQTVRGSAGRDLMRINDDFNTVYAGAGNDLITLVGSNNALVYGEAGNDFIGVRSNAAKNPTIYGGKDTDTFTGNGGEDTFAYIYGDGNKVITDYTEGEDKIEIQGADVEDVIDSASINGSDVIFKIGSGKITVKGGADIEITIVDDGGSEESYSNSRSLEIFEDNNFMTDDTSLDSITEQKFTVTEIQTAEYSTFEQDKNILVYSKEK